MTAIANRTGTDKGSVRGQSHGYTVLYDLLFAHRRMEPMDILEVGLAIGDLDTELTGVAERQVTDAPSMALWHEYFPNARFVGVDISDFSDCETDRFQFVRADCGDRMQLGKVRNLGRRFDAIFDDGSHTSFHQQRTLLALWPTLKPGGLYIIEDLQFQPPGISADLPRVPRTDLLLTGFQRRGHFFGTGSIPKREWEIIGPEINNVLLFDEDWFYRHRRQVNARTGDRPERAAVWDYAPGARRKLSLKRLLGRIRSELEGGEGPNARPRVKLAVIQKAS